MNGKTLASGLRDEIAKTAESEYGKGLNEGFERSARLIERELEGYAIVKIVGCFECNNTGVLKSKHSRFGICPCQDNPASKFNNQEAK